MNFPNKTSIYETLQVEAPPKTYYKIAALIALFGVFGIALQFQYTQYRIRRSEYNVSALEIFQKHQKLINLIGSPIKYGYVFPAQRGSIKKDHVQACIPITGQISKGILQYDASKDEDKWSINAMDFTFKDRAGGKVRIIKGSTQDS